MSAICDPEVLGALVVLFVLAFVCWYSNRPYCG